MMRDIEKAANAGNVYAMLSLAYAYHKGINEEVDLDLAVEWYKKSAAHGCARAKWELAKMYRDGNLVQSNPFEYIHWATTAADAGIPEAMMHLARSYYHGILVPKDLYKFQELITRAAELEDVLAEFYMGYMYQVGLILEKDPVQSEEYYRRVEFHGNAEMFYRLGLMIEFGRDPVASDQQGSLRWYQKASDMGSLKANYCLERVKHLISIGKQDKEAVRLARIGNMSVTEEEIQRDMTLGEADYLMDEGEYDAAIEKYLESADLGNPDAMFMLSMFYRDGEIVKRNNPLSFDYLTRAAMAGSTDAQMVLARCYELGEGCPRNINEATKYYAMAVANGNLVGYYHLSKYIERPEKYVRATQKVVIR